MGSEDFKSSCRALVTSGVGSIPTRSRQFFSRGGWWWPGAAVLLVALTPGSPSAQPTAAPADSAQAAPRHVPTSPDTVFTRPWTRIEVREGSVMDTAAVSGAPEGPADSAGVDGRRPAGRRMPVALPQAPPVWWVTVRSGILPGWGQLVNGKPLKAALLGGIYGYFAVGALAAEADRRDAAKALGGGTDAALTAAVNAAVERRNSKMWMMGATMLYAMLDAYVDAHFYKYDDEWRVGLVPRPGDGAALALVRTF